MTGTHATFRGNKYSPHHIAPEGEMPLNRYIAPLQNSMLKDKTHNTNSEEWP